MAVCSSALKPTSTRLLPGRLDSLSNSLKMMLDGGTLSVALFSQHGFVHWEIEREIWRVGGWGKHHHTHERCSVSSSFSVFFAQRSGTNGRMQQCNSWLVMLESYFHISFFVRALIVFVCQCCQTNCGVVWRTQRSPQPPSPLSVSPTSLHPWLVGVYSPLLSCTPFCVWLSLSHRLLSFSPGLFKTKRLLFSLSGELNDLLENSFRCHSAVSSFFNAVRYPCSWRQNAYWGGLIPSTPITHPFPSLALISCPLTFTLLSSSPTHLLHFVPNLSLFSPNSFDPLDHVAMCPLGSAYPRLAVLCLLDPGGELPSHLSVSRSSHCGLQRPWVDPSSWRDPLGCSKASSSWQLDTPHSLWFSGPVQWLGLFGPPEQHPILYRTRDPEHLIQTGLPWSG